MSIELPTVVGVLSGILAIIGYFTGFFRWVFGKTLARFRRSPYLPLPSRSVVIVPGSQRGSWWHLGKSADQPAMQMSAEFKATNITRYEVLLVAAKLRRPKRLGMVLTRKPGDRLYGEYRIPPGDTTDISVDLWVIPPVCEKDKTFVGDIAILDQFGNHHWINKLAFEYR